MKKRVICVKNYIIYEGEKIVYDMVQIGKQYDMAHIRLVDDEGNIYPSDECYIYEGLNTWKVPLIFFEDLDEYRNRKIDNIIKF
jgi:hypothetical protein